jgi:NAD(P)H-hydrate epimerase
MQHFISSKEADKLIDKAWARKKDAKKGDAGEVLIIGGSEDYAGCLVLAGIAALHAGCDWVTIAAPEKVGWAVQALSPNLVVKKLEGTDFHGHSWKPLCDLIEKHDVFLIGNGMSEASRGLIAALVYAYPAKMKVVDAQALRAVKLQQVSHAILTPHRGEYAALLKNAKLKERSLQQHLGSNVLLKKGPVDAIMAKGKIAYNKTGNPGMAKAGTGDVLAGLCAGFLAQKLSLFDAACLAAYINGLAGDRLKEKRGYSFIASDLWEEIKKMKRNQ